jgi:hypothetical protein
VDPRLKECRFFALQLKSAALQTSDPNRAEILLYLADRWTASADEMECRLHPCPYATPWFSRTAHGILDQDN